MDELEEEKIPDERACPVCWRLPQHERPRPNLYPTFTAMMRHWAKDHPQAVPSGDRSHDNGNHYGPRDKLLRMHEVVEDIDAWADDLEAHPAEVLSKWTELGNRATA